MRYAAFCLQITGWVGLLVLAGCSTQQSKSKFDASYVEKIHIERLDPNNKTGLYGKPNGLVALHYEFCIPGAQKYVEEVQPGLIDQFMTRAPAEVVDAMRETVTSMIGTLPPQFFEVTVTTVAENLAQLMFSVMMTGYMFR